MSEVKRYYVGKYGLVEGEALGRLGVVLGADADRLRAELECSRGDFVQLERISDAARAELAKIKESLAYRGSLLCRIDRQRDALQQRLTAADERADVLEGLLREALPSLDLAAGAFKSAKPVRNKVRAALKPADAHPCPVHLDGCDGSCKP